MNIVIAMPVLDKVEAETVKSLVELLSRTKGHKLFFVPCIGTTVIHFSRNQLVKSAYECKFDAILFIDSDMVFPPESVNELVAHDKDIVGAIYTSRVNERLINVFMENPRNGNYHRAVITANTGLQKVDAVGAGIMLVKKQVFDKIRMPYFFYDTKLSEDINFCHRARKAGFEVFCDTELEILHIGKHKFGVKRTPKIIPIKRSA